MSNYPGVRERVRELHAEAAQRAIVTVAEVLRMNFELATANPADVVRVSEHACRHCHGVDGLYQWRDQDEFANACAAELDAAAEAKRVPRLPSDAGGYGYTVHRLPNPECEECAGVGQPRVHITDSSKLTGPAAKLVKSVKQDRFGAITVELRDQDKALSELARILGAYKDGLALTMPPKPADGVAIPAELPAAKVAEAYLQLVR
jgi:phage terminase small subunit